MFIISSFKRSKFKQQGRIVFGFLSGHLKRKDRFLNEKSWDK